VPSSATLRQRFDAFGCEWSELADQLNRAILGLHINGAPIDFGALKSEVLCCIALSTASNTSGVG